MNRRLFEDLVVSAHGRRGRRGGLAFPASLGIHAAVVGGAMVLSVFGPAELLPEATARPLTLPPLPTVVHVAPRPPAPLNPRPRPGGRTLRQGPSVSGPPRTSPTVAETDVLPPPSDVIDPDDGCTGPGCLVGTSMSTGPDIGTGDSSGGGNDGGSSLPRSGVDVAPPVKIRNVEPVYPELARRAGVEGVVIIECTIDPKGRIAGARVLRGHTLLDRAALDAVQQWVYRPTLLNNAPVSVVMTVTVIFRIGR